MEEFELKRFILRVARNSRINRLLNLSARNPAEDRDIVYLKLKFLKRRRSKNLYCIIKTIHHDLRNHIGIEFGFRWNRLIHERKEYILSGNDRLLICDLNHVQNMFFVNRFLNIQVVVKHVLENDE